MYNYHFAKSKRIHNSNEIKKLVTQIHTYIHIYTYISLLSKELLYNNYLCYSDYVIMLRGVIIVYYETGLYIAYNYLANEIMFALIVCALHSFVYSLFECSVLFATCSLQIFTGVDSAYTRLFQDLYQSDLDWYKN